MAKTSVITHLTGINYVKLMQDYIEICGYVSGKTGVIKTNDCAAALLNFYEHRHNSIIESHGESKKPINLFQESGLGFLEKVLLFHYSQKSIKEANAFLEIKGYIEIRRSRISETENAPNEVLLLVDNVNFALNEYDKIRGDKNYRTLILPHPSTNFTPPPPLILPHPSTNFTESKDNTNDNIDYNQEETPTPFIQAEEINDNGAKSEKVKETPKRGGGANFDDLKPAFDAFRVYAHKIGMTTRGLNTEFDNFVKKYPKEAEEVVPQLLNCVMAFEAKKTDSGTRPIEKRYMPHVQTWINNKCWESYMIPATQEVAIIDTLLKMSYPDAGQYIKNLVESKKIAREDALVVWNEYETKRTKKYATYEK
jgi:hypothetical protein